MINCKACGQPVTEKRRKVFCCKKCLDKYNDTVRKKSQTFICAECGVKFNGYRKAKFCSYKCMGIHNSNGRYDYYLKNQDEFCNENYTPKQFKKFFLKEQNNKCDICKTEPLWNNKPLVFVLDHIDGNAFNNKRCNLRLICPNCDSQLPTFKSKNRGNGRFFRKQRRAQGKSF